PLLLLGQNDREEYPEVAAHGLVLVVVKVEVTAKATVWAKV
ncbi:hypothetical protein A2U01_0091045, partial [Trifolium medium]|nr:hypothetical protein [Trifolium medium]